MYCFFTSIGSLTLSEKRLEPWKRKHIRKKIGIIDECGHILASLYTRGHVDRIESAMSLESFHIFTYISISNSFCHTLMNLTSLVSIACLNWSSLINSVLHSHSVINLYTFKLCSTARTHEQLHPLCGKVKWVKGLTSSGLGSKPSTSV